MERVPPRSPPPAIWLCTLNCNGLISSRPPHLCSLSAGGADVCDGVPSAPAAGVLPHATGVAFRFHRITGTLPVCPGATDMVEEV